MPIRFGLAFYVTVFAVRQFTIAKNPSGWPLVWPSG